MLRWVPESDLICQVKGRLVVGKCAGYNGGVVAACALGGLKGRSSLGYVGTEPDETPTYSCIARIWDEHVRVNQLDTLNSEDQSVALRAYAIG